jgi:hypothetical protein
MSPKCIIHLHVGSRCSSSNDAKWKLKCAKLDLDRQKGQIECLLAAECCRISLLRQSPWNIICGKFEGLHEIKLKKKIFGSMPSFLSFDTQTMHIKLIILNRICYVFPKNLIPWRDSNPSLLFLRPMRCPLRQGMGINLKYIESRHVCGLNNFPLM